MKSGLEKFRGGFNPEPNKRLRLTSPLASRETGIEIGLGGFGIDRVERVERVERFGGGLFFVVFNLAV